MLHIEQMILSLRSATPGLWKELKEVKSKMILPKVTSRLVSVKGKLSLVIAH